MQRTRQQAGGKTINLALTELSTQTTRLIILCMLKYLRVYIHLCTDVTNRNVFVTLTTSRQKIITNEVCVS